MGKFSDRMSTPPAKRTALARAALDNALVTPSPTLPRGSGLVAIEQPDGPTVLRSVMEISHPKTGETHCIDMVESAYDAIHSPDPKERFAGHMVGVEAALIHVASTGGADALIQVLLEHLLLLDDLADGNYTHPALPPKRARGQSQITARAYAQLRFLLEQRRRIENESIDQACKFVARDLDRQLKAQGYSLLTWLGATGLAAAQSRFKKWVEDAQFPTQAQPAFQEHYEALTNKLGHLLDGGRAKGVFAILSARTAIYIVQSAKIH